MKTTRSASAATRFVTSRAQLSPLVRRTGGSTAARPISFSLSAPRTITLRSAASTESASAGLDSFALPSFWSSGALDRLQPEVTRYHE